MILGLRKSMLEGIKENIEKLVSLYESQKQRADELELALTQSREETQACKEQIQDLKQQISSMELTGAFTSQGGNPAAKERIDKLIKEIDRCIDFLEA